jgi:hypothetical protein
MMHRDDFTCLTHPVRLGSQHVVWFPQKEHATSGLMTEETQKKRRQPLRLLHGAVAKKPMILHCLQYLEASELLYLN